MSVNGKAAPDRARRALAAWCALSLATPRAVLAGTYRELGWQELMPRGWDADAVLRKLPPDLADLDDKDPRAQALLGELRAALDQAPVVAALDGAEVRLPGYLVPLKGSREGVREFLLVPYLGACIHSPPPPANQIVHCRAPKPLAGLRIMEGIWASGRLEAVRSKTSMGVAGYRMRVAQAEKQL